MMWGVKNIINTIAAICSSQVASHLATVARLFVASKGRLPKVSRQSNTSGNGEGETNKRGGRRRRRDKAKVYWAREHGIASVIIASKKKQKKTTCVMKRVAEPDNGNSITHDQKATFGAKVTCAM